MTHRGISQPGERKGLRKFNGRRAQRGLAFFETFLQRACLGRGKAGVIRPRYATSTGASGGETDGDGEDAEAAGESGTNWYH